jgi:hypothetical protein
VKGKCPECGSDNLVVVDRNCNYSAFSGYRRTPSDYSLVLCLDCRWPWRTRAKYVDRLRDISESERREWSGH